LQSSARDLPHLRPAPCGAAGGASPLQQCGAMFEAGNGSGYGANDGLGGVYADARSRREGASAHALGCTDAFRCGVFVGPALMLCGVVLLVRARARVGVACRWTQTYCLGFALFCAAPAREGTARRKGMQAVAARRAAPRPRAPAPAPARCPGTRRTRRADAGAVCAPCGAFPRRSATYRSCFRRRTPSAMP
jgi:hypothetical protein